VPCVVVAAYYMNMQYDQERFHSKTMSYLHCGTIQTLALFDIFPSFFKIHSSFFIFENFVNSFGD
jgi:hypothetical protein